MLNVHGIDNIKCSIFTECSIFRVNSNIYGLTGFEDASVFGGVYMGPSTTVTPLPPHNGGG